MKERLDPTIFNLPQEAIRKGYYTDKYFKRSQEILLKDNHHPKVTMQVFSKRKAILGGIDQTIAILKLCSGYYEKGKFVSGWQKLRIKSLYDGDEISPWETVMTIEGNYTLIAHLETVYLGVLARGTKIATNVKKIVNAADGKPVLFFPARYDIFTTQQIDGYAAKIGGAYAVSTDAQGEFWGGEGAGTIPHALIAAYSGDTAVATKKFAQYIDPKINIIALVDFDNNCVETSLKTAKVLGKRLWGVRLDTAENLVDGSLIKGIGEFDPQLNIKGVNPQLVFNVREALDAQGFDWVKIVVSSGFDEEKVKEFEKIKAPLDAYGIGSSLFKGSFDFTADIVKPHAKVGRKYYPNSRLKIVK